VLGLFDEDVPEVGVLLHLLPERLLTLHGDVAVEAAVEDVGEVLVLLVAEAVADDGGPLRKEGYLLVVGEHDLEVGTVQKQGHGLLVVEGLDGAVDLLEAHEGEGRQLLEEVDVLDLAVDAQVVLQVLLRAVLRHVAHEQLAHEDVHLREVLLLAHGRRLEVLLLKRRLLRLLVQRGHHPGLHRALREGLQRRVRLLRVVHLHEAVVELLEGHALVVLADDLHVLHRAEEPSITPLPLELLLDLLLLHVQRQVAHVQLASAACRQEAFLARAFS
jgi:hypothetical protein